ncbi:MAG: acyltransferase family protein [Lachnospiraceae bacterium]|nr:acyltransferase family protein [Lachnospiraceae bacterium]
MIILFALLVLMVLTSLKVNTKTLDSQYMSRDNTAAIKGIFIIIVFMSHIRSYCIFDGTADYYVIKIIDYLGQLMVAMFLFYSGFGVYESIKKKGIDYVKAIPKNRILKTFLNFVYAIILFIIMNLVLGIEHGLKEIVLAPTGWTSIGNSNWYMFAIFTLYIITYVSFITFKTDRLFAFLLFGLLSVAYVTLICKYQGMWWCDTYLCYLAGMIYSAHKEKIDGFFVKSRNLGYIITLVATLALYFIVAPVRYTGIYIYNFVAIIFCLCIIILSMRFTIRSKILIWCGQNLFWLYILQRIPMIILKHIGFSQNNEYIFVISCVILTIILSLMSIKVIELGRKHTKLPL